MKALIYILMLTAPLFGVDIIEKTLDNGMKVVLVPTKSSEDEVLMKLVAKGGFAVLSPKKQPSGRLAADIVWEVGLDTLTAEQISAKLYEASSDLQASIYPLYRTIEGSSAKESTRVPLEIIRLLFIEPKLSENDLKNGLDSLKRGFQSEERDDEWNTALQEKQLNTGDWPPFRPVTKRGLDEIDLTTVREFYKQSFSNPSEFYCVIVGNFDKEALIRDIDATLGKIPPSSSSFPPPPPFPPFPQGKKEKALIQKGKAAAFCRYTFPVKGKFDEMGVRKLELASHIIEVHLRNLIKKEKKLSLGLDVSYEFPFFPYLDDAWLTLHFFSPKSEMGALSKQILDGFQALLEQGPTKNDIEQALNQIAWSDEYWETDDAYWLMRISNIYLWGWSPKILQKKGEPLTLTPEELRGMISAENYTKITTSP